MNICDFRGTPAADLILKWAAKNLNQTNMLMVQFRLKVVLVIGLEPIRCCHRGILSPLRLPIPPHKQNIKLKIFSSSRHVDELIKFITPWLTAKALFGGATRILTKWRAVNSPCQSAVFEQI